MDNVLIQNRQPLPGTICVPAVKEIVCRWGSKCFHNIHYAETYTPFGGAPGAVIPPGACLAPNPTITGAAVSPPTTTNGCCAVTVTYTIVAILNNAAGLPIGVITEPASVPVNIPIFDVPNARCFGTTVLNTAAYFERPPIIYSATVTTVQGVLRAVFRVEKQITCFESRLGIICELDCSTEEAACTPPMPPPVSPGCPTFTSPTVCFEFCVDDELTSPYNCNTCPPPQVTADPVI